MSELQSGRYYIRSHVGDLPIDRALAEDRSLNPKRVIVTRNQPLEAWDVKHADDGSYRLSIRGSPTAVIQNQVFAILLDSPRPENWKITLQERGGYTIESADRQGGWVLPNDQPHTQIANRPLIVGPSWPPFFPPNELFEFIPADDY